jgi:hypothetical protein
MNGPSSIRLFAKKGDDVTDLILGPSFNGIVSAENIRKVMEAIDKALASE